MQRPWGRDQLGRFAVHTGQEAWSWASCGFYSKGVGSQGRMCRDSAAVLRASSPGAGVACRAEAEPRGLGASQGSHCLPRPSHWGVLHVLAIVWKYSWKAQRGGGRPVGVAGAAGAPLTFPFPELI